MPLFSVVADKLDRISRELDRLEDYLAQSNEAGAANTWSRTATIAFTLHGAYTDLENDLSSPA